jgi:hypothetical protein
MEAIFARYGPIGWLADDRDNLFRLVGALDPVMFSRSCSSWVDSLRAIREARRPESLAQSYAAAIKRSEESRHDGSRA